MNFGGVSMSNPFRGNVKLLVVVFVLLSRAAMAQPSGELKIIGQDYCVYKTTEAKPLVLQADCPPDWQPTNRRPATVYFFGGG
jgi:hypothetical protein